MVKNNYLVPDKNRTILSHNKQMEYNPKYAAQLNYIKYLADKYGAEFRIYGSFNTDLHKDDSDIDIKFFTDEPYILFHNLKNEISYRKSMMRNYNYKMPCDGIKCSGSGTKYKINFKHNNIEMSITIIDNKDKHFFNKHIEQQNYISYYLGFIIKIIKYLYYNLRLLSKDVYKSIKVALYKNRLVPYKLEIDDAVLYSK